MKIFLTINLNLGLFGNEFDVFVRMIKYWLKAFRFQTLPLALASIIAGNSLAFFENKFSLCILIFTILTAVFLQILSNLANDYGDYKHGTDNTNRIGPERMMQKGYISKKSMLKAIIFFAVLAFLSGILTIIYSFENIGYTGLSIFFLLGLAAIWSAYSYTASDKPYGYYGFGDLFVFIFFGLIAGLGTYFLQTANLKISIFLPSTAIGLYSCAVLNINNLRDLENDKKHKKNTIPVKIGEKNAKIYHYSLLFVGSILLIIFVANIYKNYYQYLFLLPFLLILRNGIGIYKAQKPEDYMPFLKQMAISTFLIALFVGLSINL